MFVRLGMCIAEEPVVGIDAVWTHHCRGGFAIATWPHERFIAREQSNGRAADRTLSLAYQFARQRSRAPEVVLVFHLTRCAGECDGRRGGHRQLAPPEAERAHMSTAFQPKLAQHGIHVTQLRVRLGLDDKPVAGVADCGETENDQRLWLADFVVRSDACLHMGHHRRFRRAESAQRAEAGVC